MKKLSLGVRLLLAFGSSLILLMLMIIKGDKVAILFESVLAEIAFISVLFLACAIFFLGALNYYMTSKK